jgi:hypothetical protein
MFPQAFRLNPLVKNNESARSERHGKRMNGKPPTLNASKFKIADFTKMRELGV